jgi:hypothetical protein
MVSEAPNASAYKCEKPRQEPSRTQLELTEILGNLGQIRLEFRVPHTDGVPDAQVEERRARHQAVHRRSGDREALHYPAYCEKLVDVTVNRASLENLFQDPVHMVGHIWVWKGAKGREIGESLKCKQRFKVAAGR